MRAREGDLIKTKSNVVFDVKGLVHPADKIIAFPRFIPSPRAQDKAKMRLRQSLQPWRPLQVPARKPS